MSSKATGLGHKPRALRWAIDLGMLVAIGLLMGFLGPFGSDRMPLEGRYAYWMLCMVGGGVIAILGDAALTRSKRVSAMWARVTIVSLVTTPPVTLLVMSAAHFIFGDTPDWRSFLRLIWQVWPILLAVVIVRALAWREPPTRVETRTVIAPPLPETEAAFRKRLSAKRRNARLIAVEAHDHYLKVHTDAGPELIALRFSDALNELALVHGWRVHRSWWVAADAVEAVRWRRSVGEMLLVGGLTAPVSRTHRQMLKEAGWL